MGVADEPNTNHVNVVPSAGAVPGVPTVSGVPTFSGVPTVSGVPTIGVSTFSGVTSFSGVPTVGGVQTIGVSNVAGVPNVGVSTAGGVPSVGVPTIVVPIVNPGNSTQDKLQTFLKGQPRALGAIQITVGVITLVFGIVLTIFDSPFSVYTGVHYWGSVIYIITGSLTVATENNLNYCLVKGSLGMNVVSTVVAGTGIILLAMDLVLDLLGPDPCYNYPYDYEVCRIYSEYANLTKGVSGVLLLFTILQFFVSICITVFGCKATCCTEPVVSVVAFTSPCCSIPNPLYTNNNQQLVYCIPNPSMNLSNPDTQSPPAYNTIRHTPNE